MAKSVRKLLVVICAVALLFGAANLYAGNTFAANLSGGQYTYVIDGEEVAFALDPIVRKDGLLLPIEVFQHFGITVEGALTRTIILRKGEMAAAALTLGSTTVHLNGRPVAVETMPVRLNGRLFIPSDLLTEFGVELTQDGSYVMLRSYVDGVADLVQYTDGDFAQFKMGHFATNDIKADSNIYLRSEATLLTPQILAAPQLDINYGARARLQGLAKTNTLVMVKLTNTAYKSGGMVTAGAFLVDDLRNQYDLEEVIDIGSGMLTSKLAPGASRTGVLVFPRLVDGINSVVFWYDNNGGSVGTFWVK